MRSSACGRSATSRPKNTRKSPPAAPASDASSRPMKARLIAVGERAPAWVADGFSEYQKRLSHWLPLELLEVTPGLRGKGRDAARAMQDEGQRVIAGLPKDAHVIALDG